MHDRTLFSVSDNREDAARFSDMFLVALLNGPVTPDLIRERAGIEGTNHIGQAVRLLHRAGLIQVDGYEVAHSTKARGRLTRRWRLTAEGERKARKKAAGPEVAA